MKYDIYINSSIGWPFSAEYVRQELEECKGKPCNVYLSSLGGAVVDALQIRQMFLEHGNVCVYMHGFVASAATILAMGAKRVVMGEFALMLVHRCSNWVETWGQMNAEEIENTISRLQSSKDALETIDRTVASIYAARCGAEVKDVAGWMSEAKWMTAEECKEKGLVDGICKDDVQAEVTDAMRGEILACGFPLPAERKGKPADISRRSLLDGLKQLFTPAAPTTDEETNPNITMEKDYKNLMAVLALDAIELKDGAAQLTAAQLEAVEQKLQAASEENEKMQAQVAFLEEEKAALEKQRAGLQAQVENLQKADGDTTSEVQPTAEEAAGGYAARARKAYEQLQHLG